MSNENKQADERAAPTETTMHECMVSLLARTEAAEADAFRYRFLRDRNLDSVELGGVFAGKTPDNVVLNGTDLDAAIDAESGVAFAARAVQQVTTVEDERSAFEAWYLRDMPHETYLLKRSKRSYRQPEAYEDDSVEDAWTGWQARATQQATKGDVCPACDVGVCSAHRSTDETPVEIWHGERKVSIYADTVIRVWGVNVESEMSEAPRTLQSVQNAVDWVYSNTVAGSAGQAPNLPCPICNGVEGCDHTVSERQRAAKAPVAWLHTMHMEIDQTNVRVELDDENPFGIPGEDYSAEYRVTTVPLYTAPSLTTDAGAVQHTDDIAIDKFAASMKEKLAQARAKGRGGWEQCDPSALSIMLREHVEKGDPRDVANFCAFLWNLNQPIAHAEQPNWTNPMTPYGMLVRALRIVVGTTLMDMATFLGRGPAELSALEFGRKPVTNADIVDAAHYFASFGIQSTTHALTLAAARKAEIERKGES